MKKKRKLRRKRCEKCGKLVPRQEWEWGLCLYCMGEYNNLSCIVLSHTLSFSSKDFN